VSREQYQLLDQVVVIRSTSPEFAAEVRHLLEAFVGDVTDQSSGAVASLTLSCIVAPPATERGVRRFHFLYANCVQVGRASTHRELLSQVASYLDALVLGETRLFRVLYAAALAKNGSGLLIPSLPVLPDGDDSGIFALLRALEDRGFGRLAGTKTAIHVESGALFPYQGPLDVEQCPRPLRVCHEPVPVRYIVVPEHKAGATAELRPLSRSAAVGELIRHSVNWHRFGQDPLPLFVRIAQEAECFTLSGSDPDAMAQAIATHGG
jgi:hypothetical protein